jgi:hypothetical protein
MERSSDATKELEGLDMFAHQKRDLEARTRIDFVGVTCIFHCNFPFLPAFEVSSTWLILCQS